MFSSKTFAHLKKKEIQSTIYKYLPLQAISQTPIKRNPELMQQNPELMQQELVKK
jgi:hypothetical protein